MKPKLQEWLERKQLSNQEFADMLMAVDRGIGISARTVESWRYNRAMPRRRALEAIIEVTGNKVTANDFMRLSQ